VTSRPIAEKYINWHNEHPQLVPYLYLNQPKYVPGDTVFFKAWLMTSDFKTAKGTYIMHVSLVNSAAREVVRQSIRITNGASGNQLILPDSLKGGYYNVVLYNNWMKYYGAEHFHQTEIEVVAQNRNLKSIDRSAAVSLHIEGGKLVYGIPSKVVVLANASGQGQLIDDRGNFVTNITVGKDHTGFVVITPESGRLYSLQFNGQTYPFQTPAADGLGILVNTNGNRTPIRTMIAAPRGSRFIGADIQVLVTIHNTIYYSQTIRLTEKNFSLLMIPQANLPSGIANLSVFTGDNELLCSRNFFVTTPQQTVVKVSPAQNKVGPGEKVTVDIAVTDESGLMVQGDMVISALNQKLFESTATNNLSDEMMLRQVDLVRDLVIDRSQNDWYSVLDQHLVASGSRNVWLDPDVSGKNPSYLNTWLFARGRVVDQVTNEPITDSAMLHLYLQKHPMAYEVKTKNSFADVYIPMDFWGRDEFFYHVIMKGNDQPNAKLEWVKENVEFQPAAQAKFTSEPDPYAGFRTRKKIIDQSYSFFKGKPVEVEELQADLNAEIEDEIMGADISVNLDNYIAFGSMDEVIREIIPALLHRKSGNRSIVKIVLINPNLPAPGNPLYIIDGVMTMDTDFFMNMDQKNVHTIKVVNDQSKLRHMGALGRSGVVFVTSKKSVADKVKASSQLIGITGLSRATPFRNVTHQQNKREQTPDFRSTIYWNPSVKTDNTGRAQITFEASDDVGPVRINVAGMTDDGRAFSGSAVVEVVFGSQP
jgi:hypothetical protein